MVSIIVLTYNRVKLLKHCIDSILNQTYRDFEIIIIDNGSNDTTFELCSSYVNKSIRYFYIDIKNSIAFLRNEGVSNSNGDFIAFCDDDDLWRADKLESQMRLINEYKIICSNGNIINQNGKETSSKYFYDFYFENKEIKIIDTAQLLNMNYVLTSSVLFVKNILQSPRPFREIADIPEDYDVWLKLSMNSKILFINENLISYRMHDNSSFNKKIRYNMLNSTLDIVGSYRNNENRLIRQNADIGYLRFSFIFMYNLKSTREYCDVFKLGLKLLIKFSIFKIVYNYYHYKKLNRKIRAEENIVHRA